MSELSDSLREVMRGWPTGVAVVTARDREYAHAPAERAGRGHRLFEYRLPDRILSIEHRGGKNPARFAVSFPRWGFLA